LKNFLESFLENLTVFILSIMNYYVFNKGIFFDKNINVILN